MRQDISITVDAVVFNDLETLVKILLVKRKNNPFKKCWALPGGFLEESESLENGAKRELQEETGLFIKQLTQLNTYGDVDRDPRGRTISVAFYGFIDEESSIKAGDDAKEFRWFKLNDLPILAFDHSKIIEDAKKKVSSEKKYQNNLNEISYKKMGKTTRP